MNINFFSPTVKKRYNPIQNQHIVYDANKSQDQMSFRAQTHRKKDDLYNIE